MEEKKRRFKSLIRKIRNKKIIDCYYEGDSQLILDVESGFSITITSIWRMQKNDIVDMYLDLDEIEIKLSIKSKIEDAYPAKRAFSITPGDSYRAVVTLEEGTDLTGIELLSYQEL